MGKKPGTRQVERCGGQLFRDMMASSTTWLEKSAADVDAINVFPVPDGDTGTNMLLTMRSALEEAYRAPDSSASAVAGAMAYGALMGARGNSGVILSQVFKGVARGLQGKESFCCTDLACALRHATEDAYKSLARPVEGTMLTVMRDAADAAARAASSGGVDVIAVLAAVVDAARDSVARTPTLLPALREAGVVDAGGQGLFVVFEGALHHLRGEVDELQYRKPALVPSAVPLAPKVVQVSAEKEEPYGYCTEFIVEGQRLKPDKVKVYLDKKGQSLVVVGDESAVRVHIHTLDPGGVLHYAASLGTLHQIKVQNMDDQHKDFIQVQRERTDAADIAIVAVALGDGFTEVFRSLGVTSVVPGGQTMNPSVRDILKAVEGVSADKVLVLPNNKNVVQTARQVPALTSKKACVVPTHTLPQGLAALLSFNFELGLEQNARGMEEAAGAVRTVEVTRAVRSTKVDGISVRRGQAIGIVDDELLVAGGKVHEVLQEALVKAGIGSAELVTLYYGADTRAADAEATVKELAAAYPQVEFEVVSGGQPHYYYIVSVE
ncbi:MAG: DAK2 domain-containing protein [Chloroflexota bacterium]